MTTGRESVDKRKGERLLFAVKSFIEKHDIYCAEEIHLTDAAHEDAYQLIEDLCEIAGYNCESADDLEEDEL
jgi:hypothetical protein